MDDNVDVQSAFSWAPKVARKCESKHWYACGADGRSVGHVITKFSGMGRFIYSWCSAGALRARSSATKTIHAPRILSRKRRSIWGKCRTTMCYNESVRFNLQ